jgi:hypothetical protein
VILRGFDSIINEDICSFCCASTCSQIAVRRDDASSSDRSSLIKLHPVSIRQGPCIEGSHCRHHEIVFCLDLPVNGECPSQLFVRATQLQVMSWSRNVLCDCAQPITWLWKYPAFQFLFRVGIYSEAPAIVNRERGSPSDGMRCLPGENERWIDVGAGHG